MAVDPVDPMDKHPEDYHDYVFKDGKLVGAFDEMYRFAKGVPWDQDKRCHDWYSEVGMLMLRESGPFRSILEMGCGLGYVTEKLRRTALSSDGVIHGFDVSAEAIRRAAQLHPSIEFWVEDVTRPDYVPRSEYDLVVIRDVFWYVIQHIDTVVENIGRSVRPGGYLYINQSFPALDRAFVGKETLPNPEALIRRFEHAFVSVHSVSIRRHRATADGPILHWLAERIR